MTPDEQSALALLSQGPQRFFVNFQQRNAFASLVMQGLARCYCKWGGEEWVRLTTDEERAIHMRNSALAEKQAVMA